MSNLETRPTKFNPSGVEKIEIIKLSDVQTSVISSGSKHRMKIDLLPGKSFQKIYFTYGTLKVKHSRKPSNSGIIHQYDINFLVPVLRESVTNELENICNVPLLLKFTSKAYTRIYGDQENGINMTMQESPAVKPEDYDGYIINVSGEYSNPAYYETTDPEPVISGSPSSSLSSSDE